MGYGVRNPQRATCDTPEKLVLARHFIDLGVLVNNVTPKFFYRYWPDEPMELLSI